MNDEVFGILNYDHGYEKEEEIIFFDKSYKIIISVQSYDKTITEEQRKSYKMFKENYNEIIKKLPPILLEYYLKIYDEFIELYFKVPEKIDKKHINEELIVRLIKPRTLFIDKKGKFGLLCDCIWDEEHGIAILFTDNSLSIVEQDELI
ncbi:MAG: hypothetical protein J6M60_03685 [Clostridia bacterium]|nr:hypothetical protein [Clostridia bacterium]